MTDKTVHISPELHKRVKLYGLENDLSVTEVVSQALKVFLDELSDHYISKKEIDKMIDGR